MWLVNTRDKVYEIFIQEETKFVKFKPRVPVYFRDKRVGIKYKDRYASLRICENPEQYFTADRPFEQLLQMDLLQQLIWHLGFHGRNFSRGSFLHDLPQ